MTVQRLHHDRMRTWPRVLPNAQVQLQPNHTKRATRAVIDSAACCNARYVAGELECPTRGGVGVEP